MHVTPRSDFYNSFGPPVGLGHQIFAYTLLLFLVPKISFNVDYRAWKIKETDSKRIQTDFSVGFTSRVIWKNLNTKCRGKREEAKLRATVLTNPGGNLKVWKINRQKWEGKQAKKTGKNPGKKEKEGRYDFERSIYTVSEVCRMLSVIKYLSIRM